MAGHPGRARTGKALSRYHTCSGREGCGSGRWTLGLRAIQFLAIVLTALALVTAGAHLFELANKIGLKQDAYFTVQSIYRGWALFGIVLVGALGANLALTLMVRRMRGALWLALAGFLRVVGTLAVIFTWTYPANQATSNWTEVPAAWQELRRQWEYAHAANALLTFLALCAVTVSALLARDQTVR
jgi:hypothetical protein